MVVEIRRYGLAEPLTEVPAAEKVLREVRVLQSWALQTSLSEDALLAFGALGERGVIAGGAEMARKA
ncbi:hypothetical protein D7Y15_12890 [Corallococcus sp. AB030]|uniref:hypothetical protein n=1 Tax=Corallococcus sp. AB030 TaxID=2316716 RepID=UPI000EC34551|nr:hypothetical protein [Corallococcus sp. AB030]RKI15820.1 hypothetical protein D7Y15_12890 [Corallococcus sp. AB030]